MTPPHRTYYQVLGVPPDATPEEIHRAYRRLARRYHPDLNPSSGARARFDELSDAHDVLHDPELRAGYDATRVRRAERPRAVTRPQAARPRTRPAPKGDSRVPVFSSRRPPRPAPRFLDDEPPAAVRLDVTVDGTEAMRLLKWLAKAAFNR